MLGFKDFLIRVTGADGVASEDLAEGVIPSGAGTKGWRVSGAKYFGSHAPEDKLYTLAKDEHGIKSGKKVKVTSTPFEHEGKMHVKIKHPKTGKSVQIPTSSLHKPGLENKSNSRDKEDAAFADFTRTFKAAKRAEGKDHLRMKIGNTVQKIVDVHQIPGNPKADFSLINDKGEHVYHISHKDGSLPKHHQGFATSHSDVSDTETFKNFIQNVAQKVGNRPNGLLGQTVAARLDNSNKEHREIIKRSVWGKDHASKKTGINNVDVVHQGPMTLKKKNGLYEIHSTHAIHRGQEFNHEYQMHVRRAADRALPGTKIKGRFFVHHVGGRNYEHEVDA